MPKIKFTHDDFDSMVIKMIDQPLTPLSDPLTKLRQAAGIAPKTPGTASPTVKLPRIPKI